MKILIALFLFVGILFLYLHVYFHTKTSNDLEVYEIIQPSKDKLEEICDLRQPVLFEYNHPREQFPGISTLSDKYGTFDVKVRKSDDVDLLPLKLCAAVHLFSNNDTQYISECNGEFIEETGIVKQYFQKEQWLKPYLVSTSEHDLLFGSLFTTTELKYEVNYRTYLYVSNGDCTIKMAPPNAGKHLSCSIDYERFVFGSPINLWNVQPEFETDVKKLNLLEFKMKAGQILYIPAYWWYTVRLDTPLTCIAMFKYKTYMNLFTILPHIVIHYLQLMNIKRKTIKKKEEVEVKIPGVISTSVTFTKEENNVPDDLHVDKQETAFPKDATSLPKDATSLPKDATSLPKDATSQEDSNIV